MKELIANPLFALAMTIGLYVLFTKLKDKTKIGFINPFLFTITFIVIILLVADIPYELYMRGGSVLSMFLTPVTSLLALSIYRERKKVKENLLPILAGTIAGSVASTSSAIILSNLFNLEETIKLSLITKCVTTPIALALTNMMGGIEGIAAACVMIAGILGNVLAPTLVKIFKLNGPSEQGIAIGAASHALGTAKALKMGEDIGALSSISLSFSAIITVIIVMIFF